MTDNEAQFVAVDALRVGMYVYLDLGWIGHPFPLNNFKIVSDEQIAIIRGLGLERLRWSPERSDLETPAPAAETVISAALEPSPLTPAEQRRRLLAEQHAVLERCDRAFSQATRVYRDIVKQVKTQPEAARAAAQGMVGDLVGKMQEQGESFIRLLSEKSGEPALLHAINVTVLSLVFGKSLGLDDQELGTLGIGALLHDIGKSELPARLRWHSDALSADELKRAEQHVAHGVQLARQMGIAAGALQIIAQHHEHVDGSGYPRQLSGDQLGRAARIVALVNHFENLCNPVNPVAAITPHKALSVMFAQSRQKLDPILLQAFIRVMGVYPPGSVVQLTDERYALVVSVNAARPLKPSVLIHDPKVDPDNALIVDLEQVQELGVKHCLKPLQLPRPVFDYLSPRKRVCYFFERSRSAEPTVASEEHV